MERSWKFQHFPIIKEIVSIVVLSKLLNQIQFKCKVPTYVSKKPRIRHSKETKTNQNKKDLSFFCFWFYVALLCS